MSNKEADDPKEPGEFTRLFSAVPAAPKPAEAPPAETKSLPDDATVIRPVSKLEEFRARVLRPQPQRPDRPARPPLEPKAESGEFTRFFQTSPSETPAPPAPPLSTSPPSVPTTGSEGGILRPPSPAKTAPPSESDFTRYFKTPQMPAGRDIDWKSVEAERLKPADAPPPAAPASKAPAPGEFTHLFGRSAQLTPSPESPTRQPPPKIVDRLAPSPVQADDFAKVLGERSAPAPSQTPSTANVGSAPVQPASAGNNTALLVLVALIAVVLLLAAAATYLFVLRT